MNQLVSCGTIVIITLLTYCTYLIDLSIYVYKLDLFADLNIAHCFTCSFC